MNLYEGQRSRQLHFIQVPRQCLTILKNLRLNSIHGVNIIHIQYVFTGEDTAYYDKTQITSGFCVLIGSV